MAGPARCVAFFAFVAVTPGCAGLRGAQAQLDVQRELAGGRVASARNMASVGLGVSDENEMPERVRRATSRLLLDRGLLSMALGDHRTASRDLAAAERIVDADEIARWNFFTAGSQKPKDATWNFFRRGWRQGINIPWGAKAYERLMISPLASLAYLASGNANAACVEARRYASTDRFMAPFSADAAAVRAFGHLASSVVCDAADEPELVCAHLESAIRVPRYDVLVPRIGLESRLRECRGTSAAEPRPNLWLMVAFGRAPSAHTELHKDFGPIVHIVGGSAAAHASATIDGAPIALPEVADLVASALADYSVATGVERRRKCVVHRRPGAWSGEAWNTLPAHVHLIGLRVGRGSHSVTLNVGDRERTYDVVVDARPQLLTMIEPTYGTFEEIPADLQVKMPRECDTATTSTFERLRTNSE